MGEVVASLGIWARDGSSVQAFDMVVDTGASFSQLPGKLLREMGWSPTLAPVRADLADGAQTTVDMGEVKIRYNDEDLVRLFIFGEDDCAKLLGSDTLQGLRMGVDPVNHQLIGLVVQR